MNNVESEDFDHHVKNGPFRVLQTSSTFSPNTARLRKQKQRKRIANITKASSDMAEKRLAARDSAVRLIQRTWRHQAMLRRHVQNNPPEPRLSSSLIHEASLKIQRWYRRVTSPRITGVSPDRILLLRALLQGHRTRRIMQSSSLAPVLRSLQDSYSVLHSLMCPSDTPPYTPMQHHHLLLLVRTFLTTDEAQRHCLLPPNCNEMFVLTLIREVLQCRRDICALVAKLLLSARKIITDTARKSIDNRFSTPPRPQTAPKAQKSSSPKPLKDVIQQAENKSKAAAHSRAQSISDMRPATAAATSSTSRRHSDSAYQQQHYDVIARPSTSASPSHVSSPAPVPARTLKRRSPKPCIVLHMMSAAKLIPAQKGPIVRDAYGDPVPDRKPGMKVSLMLPKLSDVMHSSGDASYSPSSLKTSHTASKDFDVTTLCPQWDHLIQLPLPLSDALLQHAVAHTASIDAIPRYLLHHYWSQGLLRIEVVDGDRFNSEMFMGEATVHLSGFISPAVLKKCASESDALMISGTFPLSKRHSTDRVSGSITLQAHLFLPEIDYIGSMLQKLHGEEKVDAPACVADTPVELPCDVSEEEVSEEMAAIRSHVLSSLSKRHNFQPVVVDQPVTSAQNERRSAPKSFRQYENSSADAPRTHFACPMDASIVQNVNRKSAIESVAKSLDVIAMGLQDDVADALEAFSKKLDMKKGRMHSQI